MGYKGNILIIGAGPAGISCAYQLANHNISSLLVEKETVSGGICKTIKYKGFSFDIGGHRFFTKSEIVDNIWRNFLGEDFLFRKRYSHVYFDNKLFIYPIRILDLFSKIGLGKSLSIFYDYLKARIFYMNKDDSNFKDWVVKRFGVKLYNMFFKDYTEKIWGLPCQEISSDWAAQRIQGLSVSSIVKNALFRNKKIGVKTLIDEFYYPKHGVGQMYEAILNFVLNKGSSILYSNVPQAIEINNNRVTNVVLTDTKGKTNRVDVDYLVSSMPFADIFPLFRPMPPPYVLEAAARLRYRAFLEVCLIIKGKCQTNDQWIYVQDSNISAGRIQIYKNWSPYMASSDSSYINLGVEYFCSSGDDLWIKKDCDIIKLAQADLLKLRIFDNLEVIDGFVVRVSCAYPIYAGSYREDMVILKDYIGKIENLQVIGRCGTHRYNNMDHSMLTGICAATNIIGEKRYDFWDVNEERRYLEVND